MIRASALYMVIVIALVMAVICSSLIVAGYYYKAQYQRTFRYSQLQTNIASGVNLLLESKNDFETEKTISLFGGENDTVQLKRMPWGLYTVATVKAFIQQDAVSKVFTIGHPVDSATWSALYIIDEDRPISVSGKTVIRGDAYVPKAGIKEAYVNNQAYQGDKRLVIGTKHDSRRLLPKLDSLALRYIEKQFDLRNSLNDSILIKQDSVGNSFFHRTLTFNFGKHEYSVRNQLTGNIILRSDTSITIEAGAQLQNVLIYAKSILVKSGFKGNCQLFATDSISVEKGCTFQYPSVTGVMNFNDKPLGQVKLVLGEDVNFNGILLTYQKGKSEVRPLIDLSKGSIITGQVYSQGLFNYKDGAVINGAVATGRFIYQTTYTRYENYLINIKLDAPALSPYYLTSGLMPVAAKKTKVLQWITAK